MLVDSRATLRPPQEWYKYRQDIDGLRAIAIVPVVWFHSFPSSLTGGFAGVDIFFVISGFLISGIIFSDIRNCTFGFADFYTRRIRRIFPALLVVLASCLVFGWLSLLSSEYMQLGKHVAGGSAFVSNFILRGEGGYFDGASETKPLLHLWSLALEWQFYVAWPVLIVCVQKIKLNTAHVVAVIFIASFFMNVIGTNNNPSNAFYLPWPRFWELMAGCLMAYRTHFSAEGTSLNQIKSFTGLVLIAIAFVAFKETIHPFPGWWALLPVTGACLLISAGPGAWINRVVLANPVLVWVGTISFPLYLWHWPLLSFPRILDSEQPSAGIRLAAIALSVVLAWLTTRLIERPLRLGPHGRIKALCCVAAMLVVGGAGYTTFEHDGFKFRVSEFEKNLPVAVHLSSNNCKDPFKGFYFCQIDDAGNDPSILLVGDSHAGHLVYGLSAAMGDAKKELMASYVPGLPPFFGVSRLIMRDQYDRLGHGDILAWAERTDSIKTVILATYGERNFIDGRNVYRFEGNPENNNDADIFRQALYETASRFLAAGKRVIFVIDIPIMTFDPRSCLNLRPITIESETHNPCAFSSHDYARWAKPYLDAAAEIADEIPKLEIFNAADSFCDSKYCWAMGAGKLLYYDYQHLSQEGSMLVGSRLATFLASPSPSAATADIMPAAQ